MRLDGSETGILWGTLCQKIVDSTAIHGQYFTILMLEQFSGKVSPHKFSNAEPIKLQY